MKKKKVLIVDDEVGYLTLLSDILNQCDCDVSSEAQDAMKKFSDNIYDIVLLDARMVHNGVRIVEHFRNFEKNNNRARTKIVAVTAHVERCLDLISKGADDYVLKPFKVMEIREKVYGK